MSSTESSGAPAEATATPPAPAAAFPAFGSTRGSGLARGKRPAAGPAASTTASTEYTPTAIEVVNAPREYQNPFAPAEEPAAASPAPSATGLAKADAPATDKPAPAAAAPAAPVQNDEPAELNILEPAQPKVVPAQTWESEGFEPVRESRPERPRREEQGERPRRAEQSERPAREERTALTEIPEKYLYVRPGHTYVPTPSNFGGAPRERDSAAPARTFDAAPAAGAPAKSGGFFGWLKSLFGGSSAQRDSVPSAHGEHRRDGGGPGGHRRHRGGRNRGGHGGDRAGYQGGGEGGQRRDRGGRGRSGGYRGERSEGSSQGGV